MGGLILPQADIPGHNKNTWWNITGCAKHGHVKETWVFNPRGFSFEDVLGNDKKLIRKYRDLDEKKVLPKIWGYPEGNDFESGVEQMVSQTFEHFQLSDLPGGDFGLTIDSALDEGWACVAVQGTGSNITNINIIWYAFRFSSKVFSWNISLTIIVWAESYPSKKNAKNPSKI